MINWVKIEDGCEMPADGEYVLAVNEHSSWYECEYIRGKFIWQGADFKRHDGSINATHWARVELPEE